MAIGIDGMSSGMDTASIIASLMKVEAMPQALLKAKVTALNTKITDMQSLNARTRALTTLAQTVGKPAALQTYKTTSSDASVTATASSSAAAGAIDITVTQIAQSQTSVTGAYTAWPDSPPVLTFVAKDGTKTEVTASSTNIDDVAAAINESKSGVTATRVSAGTDSSGVAQYRLQLTGTGTGDDAEFSVYRGTAGTVDDGTATDLLKEPGAATTREAQDAHIKLWAGSAAEQVVTSKTNTFSEILPGVSITAKTVTTAPVTITIARDQAAATATAKSLIDSLNNVFTLIKSQSATSTSTNAAGDTVTKLGSFTTDSTVRAMNQNFVLATQSPVNGQSPSDIGISFDMAGVLSFDAAKFEKAMAADPAKVESMLAEISNRVAKSADSYSSSSTGILTLNITGKETETKSLGTQVEKLGDRLVSRQSQLQTMYPAMEVALGKLNSQSSYLTSQFAAMDSSTKK